MLLVFYFKELIMVYKTPASNPDPTKVSEMWISYTSAAELTTEFAHFCVTYPVAHYGSSMSQIVYVSNIVSFWSCIVTRSINSH